MIMNTSSIDALAKMALQGKRAAPLALSPSLSLSSLLNTGDTKLSDSNLIAAIATARRSSMPMMSTSAPMNQALPNGVGSNDQSIYLSILSEQRRRQSMTELNSARACTAGGIHTMTSAPTNTAAMVTAVRSQAHPAAAISAGNYASMMQSQFDSTVTAPSRRRKPNFAEKLHSVLNSKECRHTIAWLPSGRSFCITDQEEFVKKVLPKCFREAKFESFSRRLKRWGFRKVYTTGLSQIIFSHDLFHRDRPDLCKIMNGRENVGPEQENHQAMAGNASAAGPFATQEQFRNVMMFQQAQAQQQATFQQQMAMRQQINQQRAMLTMAHQQGHSPSRVGSLQNSISVQNLRGSSPENIDAQAMINKAHDLVAQSMPQSNDSQVNPKDPSTIHQAKMQLTRLNDDIANCEEQLVILQQLKDLKERRRQLTGASSPRGISPSSA
eukprot:CAMPEP_0201910424 /NCGR_PEP_ID=MMETSP0903-20130614/1799_1 /ASSEMBLY_ACC=CAM_ASM_000552 /TAXON_ID=420261 /ORGANISM="Thalassiosira antarctica, Strain CCMP982" /LENGTH=439 /DNA_ID=CAMNT_0048445053 /DNA_START=81 /DNA_END=1400 /DNA_ORIENTATION=+